jgi:hypothetical protein
LYKVTTIRKYKDRYNLIVLEETEEGFRYIAIVAVVDKDTVKASLLFSRVLFEINYIVKKAL